MKRKPPRPPVRNAPARSPLMRKGGVHEKSRKAKRRAERQSLAREWPVLSASPVAR